MILKNELAHTRDSPTREHARAAIFDCIELYYDRKRLHQTLGYRTPEDPHKPLPLEQKRVVGQPR